MKILLMTIIVLFIFAGNVNADLVVPANPLVSILKTPIEEESYLLEIVICIGIAIAITLITVAIIKQINKNKNK